MAEPQPSNVVGGTTEGTDPIPANAEDRKAAAAMSSLDTKTDEASAPKKEVDMKALNAAMEKLGGMGGSGGAKGAAAEKKKEEEPKKVVKVDAGDVAVVVGLNRDNCQENGVVVVGVG